MDNKNQKNHEEIHLKISWGYPSLKKIKKSLEDLPLPLYIAECGHGGIVKDIIRIFEQEFLVVYNVIMGNPKYCHNCLTKFVLKCAKCGDIILPVQSVGLLSMSESFHEPSFLKDQKYVCCEKCSHQTGYLWFFGELLESKTEFSISLGIVFMTASWIIYLGSGFFFYGINCINLYIQIGFKFYVLECQK